MDIIGLGETFGQFKKRSGLEGKGDPGGALEGLWYLQKEREIAEVEAQFPGLRREFNQLIEMLPEADSLDKKEFPIAASVALTNDNKDIEIIARSMNRVNETNDSTQHAELAAIQDAMKELGDKHLRNCILMSTVQPCMMCTGAIDHSELKAVIYSVTQAELKGKHIKFADGFKPIRTAPTDFDPDKALLEQGIGVIGGYKREEVIQALSRSPSYFNEYNIDPDA